MKEPPSVGILSALQDENARRILEYLVENLTGSLMRLSYALKMNPEEVEQALESLDSLGVVQRSARSISGDAFVLTEKGQQLKPYLRASVKR